MNKKAAFETERTACAKTQRLASRWHIQRSECKYKGLLSDEAGESGGAGRKTFFLPGGGVGTSS